MTDHAMLAKIENILRPYRGAAIVVTDRPDGTSATSVIGASDNAVPPDFIFSMIAHMSREVEVLIQTVAGHYGMSLAEARDQLSKAVAAIGSPSQSGKMIDEDRLPKA